VPLGFSPIRPMGPMAVVTAALQQLKSVGAKMLQLKEVISGWLEVEGHVLAKVVAKHVLLCFHSWDPQVSLEPVV
jgi:hypothetical protein